MTRNIQRGRRKARRLPEKSREEKLWEGRNGARSCKIKVNKHLLDLATRKALGTLTSLFHYKYN